MWCCRLLVNCMLYKRNARSTNETNTHDTDTTFLSHGSHHQWRSRRYHPQLLLHSVPSEQMLSARNETESNSHLTIQQLAVNFFCNARFRLRDYRLFIVCRISKLTTNSWCNSPVYSRLLWYRYLSKHRHTHDECFSSMRARFRRHAHADASHTKISSCTTSSHATKLNLLFLLFAHSVESIE